jgi:hypothetical protein
MYIQIGFADQDTYNSQAYSRNVRRSMNTLNLLLALLLILLAALLAVWLACPEIKFGAPWNRVVVSDYLNGTEAPVAVAGSTATAAAPDENRFSIPDSWSEDASP